MIIVVVLEILQTEDQPRASKKKKEQVYWLHSNNTNSERSSKVILSQRYVSQPHLKLKRKGIYVISNNEILSFLTTVIKKEF